MTDTRETEIIAAYRHYTECGVIVHPLEKAISGVHGTGKKPVLGSYQRQRVPYAESVIQPYAKKDCNLGIVCGKASDISVFDIDWYRSGIIDYLFQGFDTSKWCFQTHGNRRYGHIIFRYEPSLIPGQHQELGFDILAQNITGSSNNCVCYPSIHEDGTMYKMSTDISERPAMPAVLTERINRLLNTYTGLTDVLQNCRAAFRDLWESIFKNKRDANYHKVDLFRINDDGRQRSLGMFTELKANGATEEMLLLCCMLVFGDEYNERLSRKELSHLDTSKTMTNARIERDPVLKRFYTGSNFDPFTIPFEQLEARLSPESKDAYETLMCEAPIEVIDIVRRAFLVGVFTKQGYVKKEDFTQVEAIADSEPEMREVWRHGEKYMVPAESPVQEETSAEDLAAFIKDIEERVTENEADIDPDFKRAFID